MQKKFYTMNVLSLFDGISCGRVALDKAGIVYDRYFASEVDNNAIKIAIKNYPDTIELGSVVDIDTSALPQIDLLIGGSPCQSFTFAGRRDGMSTEDSDVSFKLHDYIVVSGNSRGVGHDERLVAECHNVH